MGNLLWIVVIVALAIFVVPGHPLAGSVALVAVILLFLAMRYTVICLAIATRSYSTGNVEKAFAWFERAYKHGMTWEQQAHYGYYLTRAGKLEEAESVFQKMLSRNIPKQDRNRAKANYAITLWKLGRLDEAIGELEEIFPFYRTSNVYGTLGYLYLLKEDWPRAKSFNDEAYDYNPDNVVILDNMTQLYYKLGRDAEAEKYADGLLEKEPSFVEGYYDIALVKEAVGKYEESLAAIEKAEEIEPTFMTVVTRDMLAELRARVEEEKRDGRKRFPERRIEFEELPPGSLFPDADDDGWDEEPLSAAPQTDDDDDEEW